MSISMDTFQPHDPTASKRWDLRWKRLTIVSEQCRLPDYSMLRIRDDGTKARMSRIRPNVQGFEELGEVSIGDQDERMKVMRKMALELMQKEFPDRS